MNHTYIHLLQHRIAGNLVLDCDSVLLLAILLPTLLLCCLIILCCNVGGTLDCIFAEHRRRQQRLRQQQLERELKAAESDKGSVQPLLGASPQPSPGFAAGRVSLPGSVKPVLPRPGARTVQLNPTRTWAATVTNAASRTQSTPLAALTPSVGKYQLAGIQSKH